MNRTARIEQVENGYVVSFQSGLTGKMEVYTTFKELTDRLKFYFDVELEAEG